MWFSAPECGGLDCVLFNALLAAFYAAFAAVQLWLAVSILMLPVFVLGFALRREALTGAASWWWFLPFDVADRWPPVVQWFLAVAALVLATVGGFSVLAWLLD